MKQDKTNPSTSSVTSLAEITKLTPEQTAVRIVEQSSVAQRAFMLVAKLMLHLETTLKAGQTLGGVVLKLAKVPAEMKRRVKSTIDNGRQAMRVWKELVESGQITEAIFDGFTFGDCLAVNKVMSGVSRQKLTAADVALIMQSSPENWHEELECFFHYGQTLADRAETAAKQEAKKATTDDAGETEGEDAAAKPAAEDKPAPGKVIQMPTNPTADEALKLVAALEQLIGNMAVAEVEKVAPAIAELNDTVQASLKPAKKSAVKRKVAHRAKVSKPKTTKKAA